MKITQKETALLAAELKTILQYAESLREVMLRITISGLVDANAIYNGDYAGDVLYNGVASFARNTAHVILSEDSATWILKLIADPDDGAHTIDTSNDEPAPDDPYNAEWVLLTCVRKAVDISQELLNLRAALTETLERLPTPPTISLAVGATGTTVGGSTAHRGAVEGGADELPNSKAASAHT